MKSILYVTETNKQLTYKALTISLLDKDNKALEIQ